jgi:hypothetical protein
VEPGPVAVHCETYPILRALSETARHSEHSGHLRNRLAWVLNLQHGFDAEKCRMLLAYCRHLAVILENVLMKRTQGSQSVLSVVTISITRSEW